MLYRFNYLTIFFPKIRLQEFFSNLDTNEFPIMIHEHQTRNKFPHMDNLKLANFLAGFSCGQPYCRSTLVIRYRYITLYQNPFPALCRIINFFTRPFQFRLSGLRQRWGGTRVQMDNFTMLVCSTSPAFVTASTVRCHIVGEGGGGGSPTWSSHSQISPRVHRRRCGAPRGNGHHPSLLHHTSPFL